MACGPSTNSTMTGTCSTNDQALLSSSLPLTSRPKKPRSTVAPASPLDLARCTSVVAAGGENHPFLSVFRR